MLSLSVRARCSLPVRLTIYDDDEEVEQLLRGIRGDPEAGEQLLSACDGACLRGGGECARAARSRPSHQQAGVAGKSGPAHLVLKTSSQRVAIRTDVVRKVVR